MAGAEAEIKIEISPEEFETLPPVLEQLGFRFLHQSTIVDHFLEKQKQEEGGWNFIRLRIINNDSFIYTRKTWVMDQIGQRVRQEEERPSSQEEFLSLTHSYPGFLSLHKTRFDYHGAVVNMPATVSLDVLEAQNQKRYFLECEVLTTIEQAYQTRQQIKEWMQANLAVHDLSEAPSMLEIAQELGGEREEKSNEG